MLMHGDDGSRVAKGCANEIGCEAPVFLRCWCLLTMDCLAWPCYRNPVSKAQVDHFGYGDRHVYQDCSCKADHAEEESKPVRGGH